MSITQWAIIIEVIAFLLATPGIIGRQRLCTVEQWFRRNLPPIRIPVAEPSSVRVNGISIGSDWQMLLGFVSQTIILAALILLGIFVAIRFGIIATFVVSVAGGFAALAMVFGVFFPRTWESRVYLAIHMPAHFLLPGPLLPAVVAVMSLCFIPPYYAAFKVVSSSDWLRHTMLASGVCLFITSKIIAVLSA